MFLLDTVVISELRKPLRQRNPNLNWIAAVSSRDLFVSVVTSVKSSVESSDSKD